MLPEIREKLRQYSSKKQAAILQHFFKTGPGEYGAGDIFLGIKVPQARKIANQYSDLPLKEIIELLKSPIHEERLLALLILVPQYSKPDESGKKAIYELYLKHTRYINNWDLVDLSASRIVGPFLVNKSKKPLYTLAKSEMLWERRIAIIATYYYIKNSDFEDALKISAELMADKEDLIHKAVGWMLREVGKKDEKTLDKFLRKYYNTMPRTMLRYAIERFPESKRKAYLHGKVITKNNSKNS